MSVPTVVQAKQVIDAGGIVIKVCPATSNLPTRMTASSWKALCQSTQKREKSCGMDPLTSNKESVRRRYCGQVCTGKTKPKGLEIITAADQAALKQHHQEECMGTKKGIATCDSCGAKNVNVCTCSGDQVCSSCAALYGSVRNRPHSVARAVRKFSPEMFAELSGSGQVQVTVESEALKRIAAAIGYDGEDGEVLVKAVQAMAATMPDCASCAGVIELRDELERLRTAALLPDDLIRALDCPNEQWELAAIQTAALLEEVDRQLEDAKNRVVRNEFAMWEQRNDLAAIKRALGLADDFGADAIVEAIGAMAQSVERFRQRAIDADRKADRLQIECRRLEDALSEQNDTISKHIDPAHQALAEFGMKILRGEVALVRGEA